VILYWLIILAAVAFAAYTFALRMKAIGADRSGEGARAGDLRTKATVTTVAVMVVPALVFVVIAVVAKISG
jgi:hypothetical protein